MNSTKIRKITNLITLILLGIFTIYLISIWDSIPETIPTHFDSLGNPNAYGKKGNILTLPIVSFVICAVLAIIERFPNLWNFPVKVTNENRDKLIYDGTLMIGILKVILMAVFLYIAYCTANLLSLSGIIYIFLLLVLMDITFGIMKMIKDK